MGAPQQNTVGSHVKRGETIALSVRPVRDQEYMVKGTCSGCEWSSLAAAGSFGRTRLAGRWLQHVTVDHPDYADGLVAITKES